MKGSCLCGTVHFEITGDFDHFYLCHCSWCRKDTGSAHAANLFTKASQLTWLAGRDNVRNFRLEPTHHVRSFCINCGSAVPNTSMGGDICIVPAGSLDEDLPIKPEAHLFTGSRANWDNELELIHRFEGFPPRPRGN